MTIGIAAWIGIVAALLLLSAAAIGFVFPLWYGLGGKRGRNCPSYSPEQGEDWGEFVCGFPIEKAKSTETLASNSSENVVKYTGYSPGLSGINTNVLKVYNTRNGVVDELINPNLYLTDTKFQWRLFWGNACNPAGHSVLGPSKLYEQGQCDVCWAFGTTTIMEAYIARERSQNNFVKQSEQWLLNKSGEGCGQYDVKRALTEKSAPYKFGMPPAADCPYAGRPEYACEADPSKSSMIVLPGKFKSFVISSGSLGVFNTELKQLLQIYGPIAASINPEQLSRLSRLDEKFETLSLPVGCAYSHEVVIVGYSKTGDQEYWIIRNSWGSNFGMNGFTAVRMSDKMGLNALFGTLAGISFLEYSTEVLDKLGVTATDISF